MAFEYKKFSRRELGQALDRKKKKKKKKKKRKRRNYSAEKEN